MPKVPRFHFIGNAKPPCLEGPVSPYKLKEKILMCAPPELSSWPLTLFISSASFGVDNYYSFLCWLRFLDKCPLLSLCLWRGKDLFFYLGSGILADQLLGTLQVTTVNR